MCLVRHLHLFSSVRKGKYSLKIFFNYTKRTLSFLLNLWIWVFDFHMSTASVRMNSIRSLCFIYQYRPRAYLVIDRKTLLCRRCSRITLTPCLLFHFFAVCNSLSDVNFQGHRHGHSFTVVVHRLRFVPTRNISRLL